MVFSEGITLRESHLCQGALQSRRSVHKRLLSAEPAVGQYVAPASRCVAEPAGGRITSWLVLALIPGCQKAALLSSGGGEV